MKPTPNTRYRRAIVCASALVTLIALPYPSIGADDPVIIKTDNSGLVLESELSSTATKGPQMSAEEAAALSRKLRTGFKVPEQTFVRMHPVPDDILQKLPRGKGVIYRMNAGKVYAFDPDSYAILETVEIEVTSETTGRPEGVLSNPKSMKAQSASLNRGEVVPNSLTASLKPVPAATAARLPAAEDGAFYTWIDGAMYQVKATEYTVIDVVSDGSDTTSTTNSVAVVETPTLTVEQMVAVKQALVKGYAVPDQHYRLLVEVPTSISAGLPVVEGAEYRYLDGVVYTINPKTREIIEAATVDEITGRQ